MLPSSSACCCAIGLLILAGSLGPETAWADGKKAENAVDRGKKLFVREWNADHDDAASGDALGPMFNARSCVACHDLGGIGGAGPAKANVSLLSVAMPKQKNELVGLQGRVRELHPGFDKDTTIVLHEFSTDQPAYAAFRQKLLGFNASKTTDWNRAAVTARAVTRKQGAGPLKTIQVNGSTLLLSQRNTTALFGAGLIDSISQAEIEASASRQKKENPELAGRFAGRFGWRGQVSRLSDFVRGASATELGLQVSTHTQAINPLAKPGGEPAVEMIDLTDGQCDDLTAFVAQLPPPRRLIPTDRSDAALVKNGESLFETVGCAVCHRPTLGKVEGLYSDLLMHDMGPGLDDPSPATENPADRSSRDLSIYGRNRHSTNPPSPAALARLRQWKTPPLWGLRDSAPYLHDGRAQTVEQAIALHGGEAAESTRRYAALPGDARSRLLAFLATMVSPDSAEKRDPRLLIW